MGSVLDTIIDAFTALLKDASAPDVAWLKLSDTWSSVVGNAFREGRLQNVYNYLVMIGIGMAIVYFLIEMNQKLALEGRDLNMKSMFAPFLKFVCAIVAIRYSGEIVSYILMMNDNFVQHIADISPVQGNQEVSVDSAGGFLLLLFVVFVCIIGLLLSIVLKLVWMYKAMLYQMEVYFRLALLPVAVADVYSGMHSNGIKYIKGFLALGIYAVSMLVVPSILVDIGLAWAKDLEVDDGGNIFIAISGIIALLVAPFASLGATSVTKQLAKEALGV